VHSRDTTETLAYRASKEFADRSSDNREKFDASSRIEDLNDPDIYRIKDSAGLLLPLNTFITNFGDEDGPAVHRALKKEQRNKSARFVYVGELNVDPRHLNIVELLHMPAAMKRYNVIEEGDPVSCAFCPYCTYTCKNSASTTNHILRNHFRLLVLCFCLNKGSLLADYQGVESHRATCKVYRRRARVAKQRKAFQAELVARANETPEEKISREEKLANSKRKEEKKEKELRDRVEALQGVNRSRHSSDRSEA
jgi:hypothetical protein